MKKLTVTLSVLAMAACSYGQGFVNFANTSGAQNVSTNAAINVYGQATGKAGSGLTSGSGVAPSGYYYALLMKSYDGVSATTSSTIGSVLTDGWTFTGNYGNNTLGAGRLGGGASVATTTGDAIGSANQFIVVGWSANLGTTWAQIVAQITTGVWASANGYFGISSTGTGIGATSTTPEYIFGSTSGIQSPFTLYSTTPVPEPGTMALAALGGASLLLFRRRK